jgi:hypothetical protein
MAGNNKDYELTFKNDDGKQFNTPVPMSVVQALYHEVTGKTEKLTYQTRDPLCVEFKNLKSLYQKLFQNLEQYEVVGPTFSFFVKYTNDQSTNFSSFEKFAQIGTERAEQVTDITIEMEFLVCMPKVSESLDAKKFHRYKLSVNIADRMADRDSEEGLYPFVFYDDQPSISSSIEYVDFLIAKSFMNLVKEWKETIRKRSVKWNYQKIRRIWVKFAPIFNIVIYASAALPIFYLIDIILVNTYENDKIALWMLLSGLVFVLIRGFSQTFMNFGAEKIFQLENRSVILITDGDQKALDNYDEKNKKLLNSFVRWMLACIGVIVLNVTSSYIFDFIVSFFKE